MKRTSDLDEQRWDAVRERRGDGSFVFAVATTGIYCRSGCTARTPLRANIRFFRDADDARAAGFRACKRCVPDEGHAGAANARAIARACDLLAAAEPMLIDDVAREIGMSRFHFQRVFRSIAGITPAAFVRARRDERLRDALAAGAPVTDAVIAAGFGSMTRAYAADAVGMAPSHARRGGDGETIRFTCAACSLGRVLLAATERGICSIALGDDDDALIAECRQRFSRAAFQRDDDALRAALAAVLALVDDPSVAFDLPLDIRGTAFQQRVWSALRALPAGEHASYAQIAASVGAPRAARAVGAACSANPVALAVPCHRVVGGKGDLTGYRWGVERKRELLAREARSTS